MKKYIKDINKYNQRLLAVIGTLVLLIVLVFAISGMVAFISRMSYKMKPRRATGIVIDQNQLVDTTTSVLSQNISILEPYQLDTLQPVFIIPIGQKDQRTDRIEVLAAGMSFSQDEYVKDYYYSSFSGLYNNFVLIDYVRDIKIPLFDKKVALTEWAYMKVDSTQLILFKGTDNDLNEDGLLNEDDFQSLFVFEVASRKLKELKFENQTVRSFEPLNMTSKIYVRTGKDLNGDKIYSYNREPTDLYFYDVATGEKETLVPEGVKLQIQAILNK